MRKPKISVVMPVYNASKYLKLSIESIIGQTFKDFEFIVIDDGSKDKSLDIIERYSLKDKRIVILRNNKNLKTSKSLNKGLKIAQGKYIIRMDADDWSYPDRLENQYNYMESHPKIGVSGGVIEVCDENLNVINKRKYPLTDKEARRIIFCFSPFAHPATIWRKDLITKVGGYNENIPLSQDCELYFKIGQFSEFGNINKTVLKLRMHKNSSSISKDKSQETYAIYSRIKAIMEYGYKAEIIDRFYIVLRIISMIFIPVKFKFWLFNLVRRAK